MDSTGKLVAMALGVASSGTLHISQVLMRMGIARFRVGDRGIPARTLYGFGLMLNFTAPFWVMAANQFADTLWFTSMFATGMVTLVVFSAWILKEPLNGWQVTGALGVMMGTGLLAWAGFLGRESPRAGPGLEGVVVASVLWMVVLPISAGLIRRRSLPLQEGIFGLAAGGFLALDALWKSLAQERVDGSVGVLPEGLEAWTLLGLSFLGAAGAFLMMQWSYWRQCRAAGVMAGYNLMYVTLPLALAGVPTLMQGRLPWNPVLMAGLLVMLMGALMSIKRSD